jgi:hypothetical protein
MYRLDEMKVIGHIGHLGQAAGGFPPATFPGRYFAGCTWILPFVSSPPDTYPSLV